MPSNLLPGLLRRFQRESPPISPRNGAEIPTPEPPLSPDSGSRRDPYRAAVLVLLAASLLGAAGAIAGVKWIANPVLLDVAVTLGIAAGILIGVAFAQTVRVRLPKKIKETREPDLALPPEPLPDARIRPFKAISQLRARLRVFGVITAPIWQWLRNAEEELVLIRVAIAPLGLAAIIYVLTQNTVLLPKAPATSALPPVPPVLWIGAALLLIAAGLAAVTVSYLAEIEPARFPEASGLRQGTRVVAWILLLAAASMGLLWARQYSILEVLHYVILAVDATVCFSLLTVKPSKSPGTFPLNLGVLSMLGSRANILASILDSGERQLGIDLRSTWALTVVRRGVEPLIIGLCLLGWLSTSLTVVGVQEQGLVERLGVPVGGPPLEPGLHLHWPWPVDTVFRIPVQRVQALEVGHEGEERAGPENVLWAVEHAANEYTLLLGNGRDLITVDAAVQYRIVDARAWRYHSQNPADALRAIAYRAVMRYTVNRTLSDALSENVATLDRANARHGAAGSGRARSRRRGHGLHGGRHASAGAGGFRLRGRGLGRAREGDRRRERTGLSQSDGARGRSRGADEREHCARGRRAGAGAGGGRGLELSHAGVAVSRRPAGILLPPPSGDALEKGLAKTPLHGRGFPLPAGWR